MPEMKGMRCVYVAIFIRKKRIKKEKKMLNIRCVYVSKRVIIYNITNILIQTDIKSS